jgi:hypothetical protein
VSISNSLRETTRPLSGATCILGSAREARHLSPPPFSAAPQPSPPHCGPVAMPVDRARPLFRRDRSRSSPAPGDSTGVRRAFRSGKAFEAAQGQELAAISLRAWRSQFRAVLVDYLWLFFYKPSSGAEVWASAASPSRDTNQQPRLRIRPMHGRHSAPALAGCPEQIKPSTHEQGPLEGRLREAGGCRARNRWAPTSSEPPFAR